MDKFIRAATLEKSKLTVSAETSLKSAMNKISLNGHQIIFVVDKSGKLLGSLSDGDIRNFLLSKNVELSTVKVREVCNPFVFAVDETTIDKIPPENVDIFPVLDPRKRILRFAFKNYSNFAIGNWAANGPTPYVISEIGNNHNGDMELAKKLIGSSKESGADAVKFQMRVVSDTYRDIKPGGSEDLGVEYTKQLLNKYNLTIEQLYRCFDEVRSVGLDVICTPFDQTSVIALANYGVDAIKISSSDFTNLPLLKSCVETGIPLIVSTGMSNEKEVLQSIEYLNSLKARYCLLHCNSTYPTPFKDLNLNYISHLSAVSGGRPIGYSGHERGYEAVIAAYVLGARVIEKHFTFDKSSEGNDHKVSLLPSEFRDMCRAISNVRLALGTDGPRSLTQGEMINRENLSKSLVFAKNIRSGEVLVRDSIDIKSPGRGVAPYRLNEFIGLELKRDVFKHDFIEENCFTQYQITSSPTFDFNRDFGIPVRFHDVEILRGRNLSLAEFHLSFSDLDVDITNLKIDSSIHALTVHAPEIFVGDDLIDLAASDVKYREKSIAYLNEVKDIAIKLKESLEITKPIPIIVNVGGFTRDEFSKSSQRERGYKYVHEAFSHLDDTRIEFIAQTMPPFPWLFGGQMYHNLFVDPNEIKSFCQTYGRRICLDTSHTFLSCNFLGQSFYEACQTLSDFTGHLHISDGSGVDAEGLMIGGGEIDFQRALAPFKQKPYVSFIPEVWQGHKNFGEQFFKDLHELNRLGVFSF